MKFQNLFSSKNKKSIPKCHLLKILPKVLSVNTCILILDISNQHYIYMYVIFHEKIRKKTPTYQYAKD